MESVGPRSAVSEFARSTASARVSVKICGVTSASAAEAAAAAGADAIGCVFAKSPRRVDADTARRWADALPGRVARVAVFRHPEADELKRVLDSFRPDLVQSEPGAASEAATDATGFLPVFHDSPDLVERVLGFIERSAFSGPILLEGPGRGGRGIKPDWGRAAELSAHCPLVLAGGLNVDNVGAAIRTVGPVAVDVSSGVESAPGVKDPALIARFVETVRAVA